MKRYKAINFEYDDAYGTGSALDIVEHDEGEFVKYEDIRNLLQSAPSNSDYTAAQCVNDICAQYGLYGKGVEAWLLSRIERLNSGKAPNCA